MPYVLLPGTTLVPGAELALGGEAARHLTRVLRLRPGAAVRVGDGDGAMADAELLDADRLRVRGEPVVTVAPRPAIVVWQALGKGRRTDDVVRSCTEAGVDAITLVQGQRSLRTPSSDRSERLLERLASVAHSASEQALRVRVPELDGPRDLGACMTLRDAATPVLLAHPAAPTGLATTVRDWRTRWDTTGRPLRVVIAVGPEGGWSNAEMDEAVSLGATPVALGDSVLRTEHAALVAVAAVGALLGRLD